VLALGGDRRHQRANAPTRQRVLRVFDSLETRPSESFAATAVPERHAAQGNRRGGAVHHSFESSARVRAQTLPTVQLGTNRYRTTPT